MTNENFEILCSNLLKLVITALCIAIPILLKPLIKKFTDWVSGKIEALDDEKKVEAFNKAVEYLNRLVEVIVESIEQETASEIRKQIANGEATREDLCELKDVAISFVEAQLSDSVRKILESNIPDLDTYIADLVSQAVYCIKLVQ